jgi:hypothetical protein
MAGYRETLPRFNSRVVHRPKNDLAKMRFLPVSTGLGSQKVTQFSSNGEDCDIKAGVPSIGKLPTLTYRHGDTGYLGP